MSDRIRILDEQLLANNWGKLTKLTFEMREQDGEWRRYTREVYDRGNAACVLLYNPTTGTVLLVKQFRIPVYHVNGDEPWLIEACAGLLEGDDPETCARKEAVEESGYRPRNLTHLFDSYMSPGSVTERLSFFLAEYSPEDKVSGGGGNPGEGEDIEVLELPFTEVQQMARDGRIVDAKTIMLIQSLALSGLMKG